MTRLMAMFNSSDATNSDAFGDLYNKAFYAQSNK